MFKRLIISHLHFLLCSFKNLTMEVFKHSKRRENGIINPYVPITQFTSIKHIGKNLPENPLQGTLSTPLSRGNLPV